MTTSDYIVEFIEYSVWNGLFAAFVIFVITIYTIEFLCLPFTVSKLKKDIEKLEKRVKELETKKSEETEQK